MIMPHTGVIDESLYGQEELLMRAKIHAQGSISRFSEGTREDAIAAMYDALSSAMQRYTFPGTTDQTLIVNEGEDLSSDETLFKVLLRSGVFDETVSEEDFDIIAQILDDALESRLVNFDETSFLDITCSLLHQLDVFPFDEI